MSDLLRIVRQLIGAAAACAVVLALIGCGTPSAPPPKGNTAPTKVSSTELLKVGDLVSIIFSGTGDPPTPRHEERLKDDGRIFLPYLGPIQAAGLTRSQLQESILTNYVPKYYRHLTVVVMSESRFFYVDGQVKNPNRFPHWGEMTVLRCITAAGDFTDFAKKTKVQITRFNGQKLVVNCLEAQTHPELDVPIYPDDRIYVPRRRF